MKKIYPHWKQITFIGEQIYPAKEIKQLLTLTNTSTWRTHMYHDIKLLLYKTNYVHIEQASMKNKQKEKRKGKRKKREESGKQI